ncbi:hypothetical protein J8J14_14465 [Roseomonas sp. SSH11]|uniref:DUF5666 domain-containing protein n=1 Tax=Pararoseomonas baculiformis TaxID=2820812 RepID=A0ABS4AG24_9PROT|nr:hypothetical protein [Pararoseomonas baculiformis]MBP0445977.1 hypothetical protein [Pararoseomonas baculiformis]
MTRRQFLAAAAALAVVEPLPLWAQGAPRRVRGTIDGISGRDLAVTTREGQRVTIRLAENASVSALRRLELSAIAPGSYIGTAAEPGPDGAWRALEVLVFPEAMRGTGEGHYAWDLTPTSSMTNATVDSAVEANDGRSLLLTARGQQVRVMVPPDVPVVTPIPAAMEDLKPGAQVFLVATPGPDGTLTASRVTVARDGVVPPM